MTTQENKVQSSNRSAQLSPLSKLNKIFLLDDVPLFLTYKIHNFRNSSICNLVNCFLYMNLHNCELIHFMHM